jgi:NADH-quinone oxidoreductase subunit L
MVVTTVSMGEYTARFHAGDRAFALFRLSVAFHVRCSDWCWPTIRLVFIFWELVGLTSYLLIGFWFEKKSASDAGKKAFITTRIGDLGFIVGILLLSIYAGTLNYREVFAQAAGGVIPTAALSLAGVFIFCGAVGKSAQFPLHVWLPDAMEGPTPVRH